VPEEAARCIIMDILLSQISSIYENTENPARLFQHYFKREDRQVIAMGAAQAVIGVGQVCALAYSMIAITGVFCTLRFYFRYVTSAYENTVTSIIEDVFVLLAFMFFITLTVTTIIVMPSIYRLLELQEGQHHELRSDER
jgi:hypothetical protein